jgi:hypothetical protein
MEIKRPGHEVNQTSSSNDEVRNHWSSTSSTPIFLNDVDRNSVTVFFTTVTTVLNDRTAQSV